MISAFLRSAVFALAQLVFTPLFGLLAIFIYPLAPHTRYRIIRLWTRIMLFFSQSVCGIRYRILGAENIPHTPCIVLSKHQSAWETLAFQVIFPPQVWVLKKELLKVPFLGWGLAVLSPIAIDRGAGKDALRQIAEQGRDRLARGFWVVIFPEGTRIKPGAKGRYHIGGAALACETGTVVLPVAHNAGALWGRNAFIKYPGEVTVSVGAPINPAGLKAHELNRRVEAWIEDEMHRIGARPNGRMPASAMED